MSAYENLENLIEHQALGGNRGRPKDGWAAILIFLAFDADPQVQRRVRYVYQLLNRNHLPSGIKAFEQKEEGSIMMIEPENFDGQSLENLSPPVKSLSLEQPLDLAISLPLALAGLHRQMIVHKGIYPPRNVPNLAGGQSGLIGFGDADEVNVTGIVLVFVRRIITRCSGRTWVQGEHDHGTALFYTQNTTQGGKMKNLKRILLVEDDAKDIELTLAALAEHNLANEVAVVRDGVEALDYLYRRGSFANRTAGNPVVIMLDLKMPRLDGVQVLRQLKADERMCVIPVVVLTSSRESMDLEECYQIGVNAYVVKPVRFSEFVDAVRQTGVFWALINQPPPNPRSGD